MPTCLEIYNSRNFSLVIDKTYLDDLSRAIYNSRNFSLVIDWSSGYRDYV